MSLTSTEKMTTLLLLLQLLTLPSLLSASSSDIRFRIQEKTPLGTQVGTVTSPSGGSGNFATNDHYFAVAPDTGALTVKRQIDRDADAAALCNDRTATPPACVHELLVVRGLTAFLSVRVQIDDLNDHSPMWPTPVLRAAFAENARVGAWQPLSPSAVDPDAGANSVTAYRLSPQSDTFRLELQGEGARPVPRLVLQRPLDRELIPGYNFTVVAEDGGGRRGSVDLLVEVLDVNDESPKFERPAYAATTREDARPGTRVLTVRAADRDSGANGHVTYRIPAEGVAAAGSAFDVDPVAGHVFVRDPSRLDFETTQRYEFPVVARDGGAEPKEDRTVVTIDIVDVNDHRPEIGLLAEDAKVAVRENARNETAVSLMVSDRDAGVAGEFQCDLAAAAEFFALTKLQAMQGRVLYRLATRVPIDREAQPVLRPVVACADRGDPALTGSLTVTVEILDENDNSPVFACGPTGFSVDFAENNRPGALVANVSASDADAGRNGRLEYRVLWPGPGESPFEIDAQGLLRARTVLDREQNPSGFAFAVAATDGKFSATASVAVRLLDANDCAPVFSSDVYTFRVRETESTGVHVGEVNATDRDIGANGRVRFLLHPNDKEAPFQLPAGGTSLYTLRPIDREKSPSHVFRVISVDGGFPENTATATVSVLVDDVNDCGPVFEFPGPEAAPVRLSFREPPDFQFAEARATDADAGGNGRVSYSLRQGNLYDWFRIDPDTGRLYVKRSMSRTEMGVVRLTIAATDGGSPARSATAQLSVSVEDTPATGLLKDAWTADMETNKLIIVCIVVATGVICAALITAICLMARRRPCAPAHVNHELVRLKASGGGGGGGSGSGVGGGGGGGGRLGVRGASPGREARKSSSSGSSGLPLVDSGCADQRFGQRKLDTFVHPASVKQLIDDQSDGVPESDGDSGKGGSVSNSNGRHPQQQQQQQQHPPTASVGAALLSPELVSHAAAATLSFSARNPPDLCSVAGNYGNRSATLSRHQPGLHHGAVGGGGGGGHFQTLGAPRPRPHMIVEDSGGSLV